MDPNSSKVWKKKFQWLEKLFSSLNNSHNVCTMRSSKPFNPFPLFLALSLTTPILTGCAARRHGSSTIHFEGFVVPVSTRPGTFRLQQEIDYDSTVRDFILENGRPDYIFVVDRKTLKLIYLKSNEVALFTRRFSCISSVSVETSLTPDITSRLSELDLAAFKALSL